MARKLIDISVPLQNDVPADPPGGHPAIQYIDHQQGLPRMLQFFEGLKAEDLPDGQGWAVEQVNLSTHNGTHLDAPWHFHPTMNRGERSWTIDEVPLEWCLQPGVKLDFRHLPDGYVATAKDVENELKRIGHTLSPLEIVVVNTSAGAKYGRQDYVTSGCGQGRPPHRLLPYRKAAQSGAVAVNGFHGVMLSGQDRARLGWLDPRGRHSRWLIAIAMANCHLDGQMPHPNLAARHP